MIPNKQHSNALKAKNPWLYKSLICRRNELRRIEKESLQLTVQKKLLKRGAVEALGELAALESKSNII